MMNADESAPNPESGPIQGEFQHHAITARIRDEVSRGDFANSAVVLSGPYEFVIDFVMRLGKPERVVRRVILPPAVMEQFIRALQESLHNYEQNIGAIPSIPFVVRKQAEKADGEQLAPVVPPGSFSGITGSHVPTGNENGQLGHNRSSPSIQELYDDLKLDDETLGGVYANAVLLRHSVTEFCFDFVSNIFPRSSVNARVLMALPQVPVLLTSLMNSVQQHKKRFLSGEAPDISADN